MVVHGWGWWIKKEKAHLMSSEYIFNVTTVSIYIIWHSPIGWHSFSDFGTGSQLLDNYLKKKISWGCKINVPEALLRLWRYQDVARGTLIKFQNKIWTLFSQNIHISGFFWDPICSDYLDLLTLQYSSPRSSNVRDSECQGLRMSGIQNIKSCIVWIRIFGGCIVRGLASEASSEAYRQTVSIPAQALQRSLWSFSPRKLNFQKNNHLNRFQSSAESDKLAGRLRRRQWTR